jgi:hypothetical protein
MIKPLQCARCLGLTGRLRNQPRKGFWNAAGRFGGPFPPQSLTLWRLLAKRPQKREECPIGSGLRIWAAARAVSLSRGRCANRLITFHNVQFHSCRERLRWDFFAEFFRQRDDCDYGKSGHSGRNLHHYSHGN